MTKTFVGGEFVRILIEDNNHAFSLTPLIPCKRRLYVHTCLEFMGQVLHTKPISLSILKYEHHINGKTIMIIAVFKAIVSISVVLEMDILVQKYRRLEQESVGVFSEQGAMIPSVGR